ncbi:antitoxin [Infirmifilum lucidum]|uniref:Antitoxin n=1 Tax=Infirmifilum lucidum TaxID=2776706 RepID=A0A7L9FJD5_9CREN|nr:antitoxin [Infirmifilum lucidum]QOJ79034.1 antitoxin [Infirmifilum lucidum]
MGTVTIGVRVPRRLKEELKALGIDYAREIREYLEMRVRQEKARRLVEEMEGLSREVGPVSGNLAAELVRESRDEG